MDWLLLIWIAAIMALVGIVVNFTMTNYMTKTGRKINSPAIIADAKHQRVDILTCIAIFVGVVGSQLGLPIFRSASSTSHSCSGFEDSF